MSTFCIRIAIILTLMYIALILEFWDWISAFNGFQFPCASIDVWILDAGIPLKDRRLLELVRSAVLWSVWLERNRVFFLMVHLLQPKHLVPEYCPLKLFGVNLGMIIFI